MKPIVVCLCGSTRFKDEYEKAYRDETLDGKIVLTVGLFGHHEGIDMDGPIKAMLDQLHLVKIDLASEILVINPISRVYPSCKAIWPHGRIKVQKCGCGTDIQDVSPVGYIGQSTRREIEYAQANGKTVRYLTQ